MAVTIELINIGSAPGDGLGNPGRTGGASINTSLTNLKAAVDTIQGLTTIAGYNLSDTKVNFNIALSDGSFMFTGDAPTSHSHSESDITDGILLGRVADNEAITGLWNFTASGVGGFSDYDATFGDVTDYGMIQLGTSSFGRTSRNTASLDLDGSVVLINNATPATSNILFAMLDGSNSLRFALPKSAVGNATYNPRSMFCAGPAPVDDTCVTVGYWQAQGIFHNLACDTGTDGADLGVQNDLEVEGDIFTDSIKESTPDAGVAITGTVTIDGAAVNVAGRETIFVPAQAIRPSVTNGATAIADLETTAGRPDITGLSFIAASDTYGQFQIEYPKRWNQGTLTFKAAWESAATGTTGVAIALQAVAVSDGDTYDVAYGTAIVVTDDAQSTPEDRYVTAESAAMTVAGTPADDDVIMFQVFRDVSDANDDMTEPMILTGIRIFYTTDKENDA